MRHFNHWFSDYSLWKLMALINFILLLPVSLSTLLVIEKEVVLERGFFRSLSIRPGTSVGDDCLLLLKLVLSFCEVGCSLMVSGSATLLLEELRRDAYERSVGLRMPTLCFYSSVLISCFIWATSCRIEFDFGNVLVVCVKFLLALA